MSSPSATTTKHRIEYLDGHRGVAILLVALFHTYARWPDRVPFGAAYSEIFPIKYGWLGVELFFLLSGFVILMTLEKCATPGQFIYRRWLRLFPAMLICSVLVFATAPFFFERPIGIPHWDSLLPGLSFIDAYWWTKLFGHPVPSLEGAFWSLYVEFKFYLFAAVVYYWRGRNALIAFLFLAYLVAAVLGVAQEHAGVTGPKVLYTIISHLSFRYFGWFAAGAAFYVLSQNRTQKWLAISLSITAFCVLVESAFDWQKLLATAIVSALFAGSVIFQGLRQVLRNPVFQFFGLISYPFYLIHENMAISLIIKMNGAFPAIPKGLLPLLALSIIAAIAFLIVKYGEPVVKRGIVGAVNKIGFLFVKKTALVSPKG